ncbi:hypothetical protein [Nocardia jinanensis]|uniref:Mce-associated membrane protein n=1 Tax=Nocardia jinanensis TaxID=382504 RepID=A0A917RMX5_9NOCA|nr:hypothetical protein [Nocardia jinanensis]GGL15275.1 hypothetical protein GCM10011588_32310 [Nocardia jinanensis]
MADHVEPGRVAPVPGPSAAARARVRAARAAAEAAIAKAEAAEAVAAAAEAEAEAAKSDSPDRSETPDSRDTDEPPDADADADEAVPAANPPRRERNLLLGIAAAVVVAIVGLIGVNGYLAVGHRDAVADSEERLGYLQAARQGVVNVLTVNHNTAEDDVARILDDATGAWRDEFTPQSGPFRDVVRKAQVVTTGEVTEAGLERVNDDGSAQVLVAAHSKVSNAGGAKEEPRTFRVRVTVAPEGDRFKIAKMEYIAS